MKEKILTFTGILLTIILGQYLLTSCENTGHEINTTDYATSKNILMEYGNLHNQGLDYIKTDLSKYPGDYTKNRLDSTLVEFVSQDWTNSDIIKISALKGIKPMTELMFNDFLPSISKTRTLTESMLPKQTNIPAYKAVTECLGEISNILNNVKDNDVLDNKELLFQLLQIINNIHIQYQKQYQSDSDAEAINTALGILYGSIEYWTNSNNVNIWTQICMDKVKEEKNLSIDYDNPKTRAKEEKKEETLSQSQWIILIATVDTAGGLLGSGIATVPAAAAASAAAALYFDVE